MINVTAVIHMNCSVNITNAKHENCLCVGSAGKYLSIAKIPRHKSSTFLARKYINGVRQTQLHLNTKSNIKF
jgi:hypothetical protein